MVDEVSWEIYVDFFFVSGLSGGFYDGLVHGRVDVLESYFSWRGYSSFMLTWKYCIGCLVVYFGDLILGFLARGDSGEGGGVVGFWMMADGMICAVFGELGCVMVVGAVIWIVCRAAGGVFFSGVVGVLEAAVESSAVAVV